MSEENQQLLAAQAHAALYAETNRYMASAMAEARADPETFLRNSANPPSLEEPPFNLPESRALLNRVEESSVRRAAERRGQGGAPPPPPPAASHAPAPAAHLAPPPRPAPASSSLADRDYANLSNFERMQLAEEDPEAFARNRAEWEKRGAPNARAGIPIQNGYEHWTNQERMTCAATDPDRFESARKDWIARGEPVVDEPPEAA